LAPFAWFLYILQLGFLYGKIFFFVILYHLYYLGITQFFQMVLYIFLFSLLVDAVFADQNGNFQPRVSSRIRAGYHAKRDAPANTTAVKLSQNYITTVSEVKILSNGNATWQTFNLTLDTTSQIS